METPLASGNQPCKGSRGLRRPQPTKEPGTRSPAGGGTYVDTTEPVKVSIADTLFRQFLDTCGTLKGHWPKPRHNHQKRCRSRGNVTRFPSKKGSAAAFGALSVHRDGSLSQQVRAAHRSITASLAGLYCSSGTENGTSDSAVSEATVIDWPAVRIASNGD